MPEWHEERVAWAASECPDILERLLVESGGLTALDEYLEHVTEAVAEGRDEASVRALHFAPVMARYARRSLSARQRALAEHESDREWARWSGEPGEFGRIEIQHPECGGEVYRVPMPDSQSFDMCGQCGEHIDPAEVLDQLEEQARRGLEPLRRVERSEKRKQPAEVAF